jgi:hypothetical protein
MSSLREGLRQFEFCIRRYKKSLLERQHELNILQTNYISYYVFPGAVADEPQ